MRKIDLEQDSSRWLEWRSLGLGASDAASLLGMSSWTTPLELWKEKRASMKGRLHAGEYVEKKMSPAMKRGKDLEPEARRLTEALTGMTFPPFCAVHDEHDWLKASLDGYDEAAGVLLEIKCPNDKAHSGALLGMVPDYYHPQLIHQSLVTGVSDFVYASYCPDRGWKGADRLALVPVTVTQAERDVYLEAAWEFWEMVQKGTPPKE